MRIVPPSKLIDIDHFGSESTILNCLNFDDARCISIKTDFGRYINSLPYERSHKYDDLGLYFGPDQQLCRGDESEDDMFDAACQWILGLSGAFLVFSAIFLFWG